MGLVFCFVATLSVLSLPAYASPGSTSLPSALLVAAQPNYCRYVLSTFFTHLHDNDNHSEIQEQLNRARDLRQGFGYGSTTELSSLFSSGLIYRALGDELQLRGVNSTRQLEGAITVLTRPENQNELFAFINNIIHRALVKVGDLTVKSGLAGAPEISARSKKLGVSPDDFLNLLDALREEVPTNFTELKLALADELFDAHRNFSEVVHFKGLFERQFSRIERTLPLHYIGMESESQQALRIINLKIKNLSRLSGYESVDFETAFVDALEEMNSSYLEYLNDEDLLQTLDTLIAYLPRISTPQIIKRARFIILQNLGATDLNDRELADRALWLHESAKTISEELRTAMKFKRAGRRMREAYRTTVLESDEVPLYSPYFKPPSYKRTRLRGRRGSHKKHHKGLRPF